MKRILITGGPTNEYIDEVMKITNMSSGRVAVELADYFVDAGYEVTLLLTKTVKHHRLDSLDLKENFALMRFETTEELLTAIETCATMAKYDLVIHSAAVADYKPEFSFRAEDMAKELANVALTFCVTGMTVEDMQQAMFKTLTNPKCKVNDNTKISSVEPNLTVKLGLTPKIIASLRQLFPDATICGFKLLENVPENELVAAAVKQLNKCHTDLCFANDLAELRKGNYDRLVVTPDGYHGEKVTGAMGIFRLLSEKIGK
ncbi:MAG: hypothetical protein IJZ68_05725 [Bacteroidaceae bacterium]|nr:hypothetical protein [Bacteroidaceae bacterium]